MVSVVTGHPEAPVLDPLEDVPSWWSTDTLPPLPAPSIQDEPDEKASPAPAPRLTRAQLQRRNRRRNRWSAVPWLLALGTLALRLATAATGPTDWDSAQYASAVRHFDITHGQPQPPGYWLYVESGRLLHSVTGMGTIAGLVLVSALASALAVGLTTVAGRDLGGGWVGLVAGIVVALSPFAWFSGSIVATYSFDMVACSLLVIFAWRARPNSWHGVYAAAALGVLAGFRQSIVTAFALLALLAVIGSTRRLSRLGITVVVGIVACGSWFVPMLASQPGGFQAWLHATRLEVTGAAQQTSVLDHATGTATNFGTFAAYTALALAPLAALALLAGLLLLVRRTISAIAHRGMDSGGPLTDPDGSSTAAHTGETVPAGTRPGRPWYRSRPAVLGAAIVPPVLLVTVIQFAKGGYLLAYLPAAVIALLLPLGALNRRTSDSRRLSPTWVVLTSLTVGAVALVGAQRFVSAVAAIPPEWTQGSSSLWLDQPRYQAPYATTAASIRLADSMDAALGDLGSVVHTGRDVVVFDTIDGGQNIYRNAGWELPGARIALVGTNQVMYNELGGGLFYAPPSQLTVAPGGSVLLVASPALPGLEALTSDGDAVSVATTDIGGFRVWRVRPGVSILGVPVLANSGPRPLGHGV